MDAVTYLPHKKLHLPLLPLLLFGQWGQIAVSFDALWAGIKMGGKAEMMRYWPQRSKC
jgi:hypothetical protein